MTTTRPRMANLFVHGERLLVEKNDFPVIFQRWLVDLLVLLDATAHKDLPASAQHCLIVMIIVMIIGIDIIIRVGVIIMIVITTFFSSIGKRQTEGSFVHWQALMNPRVSPRFEPSKRLCSMYCTFIGAAVIKWSCSICAASGHVGDPIDAQTLRGFE